MPHDFLDLPSFIFNTSHPLLGVMWCDSFLCFLFNDSFL